ENIALERVERHSNLPANPFVPLNSDVESYHPHTFPQDRRVLGSDFCGREHTFGDPQFEGSRASLARTLRLPSGHAPGAATLRGFASRWVHYYLPAYSRSAGIVQKREIEPADGAIALLGNNDFGAALEVGIVLLVNLFAEDKQDHVGILFDRAGFAQVGKLRPVVAAPAFGSAAELRQSQHGDLELFGKGLKSAGNCRHL